MTMMLISQMVQSMLAPVHKISASVLMAILMVKMLIRTRSQLLVTSRRIVYETLSVESAAEDLGAVLNSAIVRPVGLCDDGTSEPTHVVLSREDYLALLGVRDKWLKEKLQQSDFLDEMIGPRSII
ncbi:MAG: hypothetical protein CL955_00090 [Erythrobacteraceae bacterium]|nr:hypothetical protein [Erythrobacteraceae bacterium]|tara:strand:+ start:426 stop:803 length:378 start_codon:yes stop_codon:yes gene_type:complete